MAYRKHITEEDFLKAYDEYADEVFRHCHLRIVDRDLSKDLMYEAFRQLWLFIAEGNYVDSMKIHLYRTVNRLIEAEKKKGRGQELATETVEQVLGKPLSYLHQLSPRHLALCVLHYIDGFSPDEIRQIVGGSADEHGAVLKEVSRHLTFLPLRAA